jgi:phosphohistidine swiveling domain-containing protein
MNIETCFMAISQRYVAVFEKIDDDYLRERVSDIRDVTRRLLANLLGRTAAKLGDLVTDRIIIANDISPSDTAGIDSSSALAIVTEEGSRTSHAVIVARSMRIPAVVGIGKLTETVESDDMFIVDGYDGIVIVTEVGAADADVDHIGDRLAAVTPPGAAAYPLAELTHLREHGVDRKHGVLTIDPHRPVRPVAERDVENRAALGAIDPVAGEHAIPPALEVGLPGEVPQQAQRLRGDPVFRVVEQQVALAQREAREAPGIVREQIAQMDRGHRLGMTLEHLPRGRAGQSRHGRSPTLLGRAA